MSVVVLSATCRTSTNCNPQNWFFFANFEKCDEFLVVIVHYVLCSRVNWFTLCLESVAVRSALHRCFLTIFLHHPYFKRLMFSLLQYVYWQRLLLGRFGVFLSVCLRLRKTWSIGYLGVGVCLRRQRSVFKWRLRGWSVCWGSLECLSRDSVRAWRSL